MIKMTRKFAFSLLRPFGTDSHNTLFTVGLCPRLLSGALSSFKIGQYEIIENPQPLLPPLPSEDEV